MSFVPAYIVVFLLCWELGGDIETFLVSNREIAVGRGIDSTSTFFTLHRSSAIIAPHCNRCTKDRAALKMWHRRPTRCLASLSWVFLRFKGW